MRSKKPGNVYTIGNESTYDKLLATPGARPKKIGERPDYQGGICFATPEDARRFIEEDLPTAWGGELRKLNATWAIYRLKAEWGRDTEQSENGWWHRLLFDSQILEKTTTNTGSDE